MSRAAASAIPSASSATGWPKTGPIPSTSIPRAKQRGVVDVRQEVALDVEHGLELRSAREPVGRERGLADDGRQLGEQRLDELGTGRRAVVPGDRGERLEPPTCLGREDLVERPRVGVDEETLRREQ